MGRLWAVLFRLGLASLWGDVLTDDHGTTLWGRNCLLLGLLGLLGFGWGKYDPSGYYIMRRKAAPDLCPIVRLSVSHITIVTCLYVARQTSPSTPLKKAPAREISVGFTATLPREPRGIKGANVIGDDSKGRSCAGLRFFLFGFFGDLLAGI